MEKVEINNMAFMLDDIKSFAKHIQESGTDAEDCVENILKELDVPYSRPRGVGLKIDYMIESDKVIGVELKYQNDGQTAYEKVPHAVYKYIFHNPKKLDEMWILLFGKGWDGILSSPSGKRILGHIKMIQDLTDTEIIIIKDINEFINKLRGEEIKNHDFF